MRTEKQELHLLRQQRDFTRKIHMLLVEFLTVEGLFDQWSCSPMRPGLDEALAALQPGDVLTVWRLDRLGRTMRHLVNMVHEFGERGIGFQSITEAMDTTTAGGELLFHIAGALAQFERRLIAERSRAGIAAARKRGKHLGRPAKLTPEKITHARQMIDSDEQSVSGMAEIIGVHRTTLHTGLKKQAR
jgi:DNA invertase Pin-like site-specific DNA recombinase